MSTLFSSNLFRGDPYGDERTSGEVSFDWSLFDETQVLWVERQRLHLAFRLHRAHDTRDRNALANHVVDILRPVERLRARVDRLVNV